MQGNPRTTAILAVANANNLKLEVVHTEPAKGVSDDYRKLNKLGQVPTFEGTDGYLLTECIAIAIYSTYWHCLRTQSKRMNIIHHFQLSLSEKTMLRPVFTL